MEENMTDKQFKTILEMVDMILDGCKDLEEAKQKVKKRKHCGRESLIKA